jgi:hypothetical protein
MELEGSLLCSQEPATGTLVSCLIPVTYLRSSYPSYLFPSVVFDGTVTYVVLIRTITFSSILSP